MDAVFNDKDEVRRSTSRTPAAPCPGSPRTSWSRCYGRVPRRLDRAAARAAAAAPPARASSRRSAEYQYLAAEAAWEGTRRDAIRALAANPLVLSLPRAERMYDELAAAHRAHLPERLAA